MPLNGSKNHPLSKHAFRALRLILSSPVPTQEINPGVVRRLIDGRLADIVNLPSPYKTHKGKLIAHLDITEAGKSELAKNQNEA